MPRGTITRFWLFLCCVAVSRQLSITEFEVPKAAQSGEDVVLKCSYDLGEEKGESLYVKWWLIPLDVNVDNRTQLLLYQRIQDLPGLAIRHNVVLKKDEQDTIVLLNVMPTDSGTYECEVSIDIVYTQLEVRKHQDLIVYTPGTGPQLNLTTVSDGPDDDQEEDVLIECEAAGVAPIPLFRVTVNGLEVNLTNSVTGPDDKSLYEIYGNVTLSKDDVDDAEVRCELIFENPDITHQQYIDTETFSTGADTTTEAVEDTTELDTTPNTLQDESLGYQTQASWMVLSVLTACLLSLV